MPSHPPDITLWRLFVRFLRFGLLAWGGPVAQIGMLKAELVDREQWVEPRRFNRVLSVYQALPGPEAHELCVYFGMLARGRIGGFLAGLGFMLPGTLAVLAASWLYVEQGIDGRLAAALVGVQVAALALVLRAVHRIGKHALHDRALWAIAVATATAVAGGAHFSIVLAAGALAYTLAVNRLGSIAAAALLLTLATAAWLPSADPGARDRVQEVTTATQAGDASTAELALSGLKAGSLSFGGAYTVIGFVREDAVAGRRWLTDAQFLDGLALSGSLPAPLIVFATFVGYLGGGLVGAIVMTIAIFLPAFVITLLGHRTLERVVDQPRVHRLLDGLTAAVVGLIVVTAVTLGAVAIDHVAELVLLVAALVILMRWKSRVAIVTVIVVAGGIAAIADAVI